MPWEFENGLLPGRGAPGRRLPGAPAPGRPPVEPGRGRGVVGAWPLPGAPSAVRAGGSPPVRAAGRRSRAGRPGNRRPGARRTDLWLWAAGGRRRRRGPRLGRRGGRRCGGGADSTTGAGGDYHARAGGRRLLDRRGGRRRRGRQRAASTGADGVAVGRRWRPRQPARRGSPGRRLGPSRFSWPAAVRLVSFSSSRLSTGASTVEEADRTNSPMSFSMLRTVLLSTPSSFASS